MSDPDSRPASGRPSGAPSDEPPLVTVRGPADLAQLVPYLMGFHPTRSLVIVGLADRRVQVSARMDLDELLDAAADLMLADTLTAMAAGGAQRFVGIVYDDDALPDGRRGDERLPWAGIAAMLDDAVGRAGAELDEIALVSAGRIYSFVCHLASCCPPEGRVLDTASTAAAEATYAGLVALPDRASLAALLDPASAAERRALLPDLEQAERDAVAAIARGEQPRIDRSATRAVFAAARAADGGGPPATDVGEIARFGVALRRVEVRDSVWLAVDDGRLDGRTLWRAMARRLPAPFDAPALFLFAWASYRAGDGALAGIAAERALASDPAYRAADLVLAALSRAINPHRLPKLRDPRSAGRRRRGRAAPAARASPEPRRRSA